VHQHYYTLLSKPKHPAIVTMDKYIEHIILESTKSEKIDQLSKIQTLWSGYGEIIRCSLQGSHYKSVIVKHIKLPNKNNHPRGWNTNLSHQRKIKSYEVEIEFYKSWSTFCSSSSYVPKCIYSKQMDGESLIILEDLDDSGFSERKTRVNLDDVKIGLNWLAHFHVTFMGQIPHGLWETGTYWHLETRPDELAELKDLPLKNSAVVIDKILNDCKYKTFVHGDAKLANFCFSSLHKNVAAVDFQYVGGGCGIKDVVYFLGSSLTEEDCEMLETELLDFYFDKLTLALTQQNSIFNIIDIEQEWRSLYAIAWTDFYRFIKGWSPQHWKINSYSEKIASKVLINLEN
jgi:hypothetical protein